MVDTPEIPGMNLIGLGIGLGIAAEVTKPFLKGAVDFVENVEKQHKDHREKFDPDNPFGL